MQANLQKPKLPKANSTNQQPVTELTFLEHAYELRSRLFWTVLTIVIAAAAGFQFKDQLIAAVMAPLHGEKLVYLTPGGGFSFIFTLSIYFGLLLAIPVVIYHLYRFMQPMLQQTSRRLMLSFMSLSILLAVGGAAFGYFVTIPAALNFLSTFAGEAVTPNLTADSYLNFVVAYVLGLALLFQLPLLLFLFDRIRPFPPGSLLSTQRFIIIGATIVAAVITPTPDAFNMAIVAVPIVAIYQFGVVAVFIRHQAKRRAEKAAAKTAAKAAALAAQPVQPVFETAPESLTSFVEEINQTSEISEESIETQTELAATELTEQSPVTHTLKTVDGFVVKPQRTSTVTVPPRSNAAARLAAERFNHTPTGRSLDGFAMRKAIS